MIDTMMHGSMNISRWIIQTHLMPKQQHFTDTT